VGRKAKEKVGANKEVVAGRKEECGRVGRVHWKTVRMKEEKVERTSVWLVERRRREGRREGRREAGRGWWWI